MLTILASFLSAFAMQAAAPPTNAEQDAIVVIGKRLNDVQIRLDQRVNGTFRCRVEKSSGSARIDREMASLTCSVARKCYSSGADQGREKTDCIARLWEPAITKLAERLALERDIDDAAN